MESFEVVNSPPRNKDPVILVMGKLEGLHLGHQRLLEVARDATTRGNQFAVYEFINDAKEEFHDSLTSYEDKFRLLKSQGVDRYYRVYCTKENKHISPDKFILEQMSQLNIQQVIVEEDFRLGDFNVEKLTELSQQIDIPVTVVPSVTVNGNKVSSTTIRSLVQQGFMEASQAMLGRPFELTGVVEKGEALGRELGFPTLNLGEIDGYVEVKPGVYLGVVKVLGEAPSHYYTLISAGYRPTVNGNSYKVEAYLLDFSGDLYHRVVSVKFLRHLRDEVDFEGIDALVEHMKQDEKEARKILGLQSL